MHRHQRLASVGAALTIGACLASSGPSAHAFDSQPRPGLLQSREFVAPELIVGSRNVPLAEISRELPNRGAWEAFEAEHAASGEALHVFIDPRSGAATNIMASTPLLPGDGRGNRVTLAELSARLGRAVTHVDAAVVAQAARRFVIERADLLGIDAAQLGTLRAAQVTDTLWQVGVSQALGGVSVRNARLVLTISHGNVVAVGTEEWGEVGIRTQPELGAEKALDAGFEYAGGRSLGDVLLQPPQLEILVAAPAAERAGEAYAGPPGRGYAHRLAWSFVFQRPPEDARWEVLVDARSGDVLAFQDTNDYIQRQLTGGVYPVTSTGVCPNNATCGTMQSQWPMPFADTGLAAPASFTNSAGIYDYAGLAPTTTLTGRFVDVSDSCGLLSASSATGDIDLGGTNGQHDCVTPGFGGAGNTPASRSAFYETNKLAEQARGFLPANAWLQSRLVANVNIALTCNAFWNGSTVNFYRSGGGCRNTGEIAAVFDHEWGHGLDDNDALGVLSNSSEAYADIAAIYRLQASCVGFGFFDASVAGSCGFTADGTGRNQNENQVGGLHCDLDCSGVRDADWDRHADHTPDTALGFVCGQCAAGTGPCGRQVHCAAAPSRQAAWDLAARDLQAPPFSLDSQSAFLLANKLFYQGSGSIGAWHACACGVSSDGCGATNAYIQWLTADDDNGSLNDGTPHMSALFAAFNRHGIACAAPAPVNSGCADRPAAPTLTAGAGAYSATLNWDAVPGAASFWVLRSEGHAGCDFGKAKIAEVTTASFTDTEVAAGRPYFYNVVARGASSACLGAASNCVQVTPTVSTDPDFTVSCVPTSLSVGQGGSVNATCTVTSANGFSSEVGLACGSLPTDASCAFAPPAVTPPPGSSVTSTLTLTTATTTPGGTTPFQVSGTSGALTRSANLTVAVLPPDFSIACTPISVSVVQGNSATSTCTVTSLNGFSAEVSLACSTLPAGAACNFSPASVTPAPGGTASAILTITAAATTPAGTSPFQVVATSGALARSANLTLAVLAPSFTVACAPSSLSVVQGNSATSTCTITSQNTFSAEVALSCGPLPAGASCAFSPALVTPPPNGTITSTLTVSTATTTPGGATAFQVIGTGGGLTRTANLTLSVLVPNYSVSCTPAALSVVQGNSVVSTCTVTSINTFSAPVALSCTVLPAGAACSFSAPTVTPPPNGTVTSTLTVSTATTTPGGLVGFQVVGTSGALTRAAGLSLNVLLPNFSVACTPSSVSVVQGNSASTTCRITSTNTFSAPVSLSCGTFPAGAVCAFNPAVVTPAPNGTIDSLLTLSTATTTPAGTSTVQVIGSGGGLVRTTNLSLTVTLPPDFALSCNPASLSTTQGGSATSTCIISSLRAFSAPVSLSCSGLPPGASCAFGNANPTPPANGSVSSVLTVSLDASLATGAYPFSVVGTSGALLHAAALNLSVTATVFSDDFETAQGWVTNPNGTDTANRGQWERAVPVQYTGGGIVIQNGTTPSPVNDLVTQASTAGSNGDIDNGSTSVQSPPIDLPAGTLTLSFSYYLAHRTDSSTEDYLRVRVVGPTSSALVLEELGSTLNDPANFTTRTVDISSFAGQTIRILIEAADLGVDNLLEAAVDNVKIIRQ